MVRDPCEPTSLAERGATRTMNTTAGRIDAPDASVEYPSTFWTYCWLTYTTPIRVPKTMIPAKAATQNVGRAATRRS
jgi:hypothetical protein